MALGLIVAVASVLAVFLGVPTWYAAMKALSAERKAEEARRESARMSRITERVAEQLRPSNGSTVARTVESSRDTLKDIEQRFDQHLAWSQAVAVRLDDAGIRVPPQAPEPPRG